MMILTKPRIAWLCHLIEKHTLIVNPITYLLLQTTHYCRKLLNRNV